MLNMWSSMTERRLWTRLCSDVRTKCAGCRPTTTSQTQLTLNPSAKQKNATQEFESVIKLKTDE